MLTDSGREFLGTVCSQKIYEFYRQALASFRFDDKVSLVHFLNQLNKGMDGVKLDEGGSVNASNNLADVDAHR
ncbi:hypothetical protein ACFFYR_22675 [Paraburkholderia dipogonis]|uniref:hypothetical protein n=1 Tax=Paraburkholderia dipogonis TaxID=1211383 RepID=UPI0035E60460